MTGWVLWVPIVLALGLTLGLPTLLLPLALLALPSGVLLRGQVLVALLLHSCHLMLAAEVGIPWLGRRVQGAAGCGKARAGRLREPFRLPPTSLLAGLHLFLLSRGVLGAGQTMVTWATGAIRVIGDAFK